MPTAAALRDPLLQPFRLKCLSLRNRIMSTSHAATIDEGGLPKERYQRYHEEKAKGGIALAIANELGIPVKLIGIGEQLEDLRPFDADDFAKALLTA